MGKKHVKGRSHDGMLFSEGRLILSANMYWCEVFGVGSVVSLHTIVGEFFSQCMQ